MNSDLPSPQAGKQAPQTDEHPSFLRRRTSKEGSVDFITVEGGSDWKFVDLWRRARVPSCRPVTVVRHTEESGFAFIGFAYKWKVWGTCLLRYIAAAAAAELLQSCPTLCDPIDSSPPGSPVPEILKARTLEWVAIFFSNAWKWRVKVKSLSRVRLLATPWTAAYQAPESMGFSRREYWSGVLLPSP